MLNESCASREERTHFSLSRPLMINVHWEVDRVGVNTVQVQLKSQRILTLLWPLLSDQEAIKLVGSGSQRMETDF